MRRNFDLLIGDFKRILAHPEDPERRHRWQQAVWNLTFFDESLAGDPAKIQKLVEITAAVRGLTGAGRINAEEKLMDSLVFVASVCHATLEDAGVKHLAGFEVTGRIPASAQPALAVLKTLCGYALDCFVYKRPRDAASGRRREKAFEILTHAGQLMDLPEVLALARKSLRKPSGVEVEGAFLFLSHYYTSRDAEPDEQIVDELLALSQATGSRSTAVGALNVLVQTGVIDELSAVCHMDDWKDEHLRR
jgi:hypothetical protein